MKKVLIIDNENNDILYTQDKLLGRNIHQMNANDLNIFRNKTKEEFQKHGIQNMTCIIGEILKVEQVNGEYYSHDYDKHSPALATKTIFIDDDKNTYTSYYITCLNSAIAEGDGHWSELYSNGFGDTFTPHTPFTI